MKLRLSWAVAALLICGLVATGLSWIGSSTVHAVPVAVTGSATVVCPSHEPALVATRVRATSGSTARVLGSASTVTVTLDGLTGGAQPYVVTGDQSLAALSVGGAAAGPLKGLWATGCDAPAVEQTLVGLTSDATHRAFLLIANPDPAQAIVDVSLFDASGRVQAAGARGLVVLGNSTRTLALEPLVQAAEPVTAVVRASTGRVRTVARVEGAGGADWVGTAAPAAPTVVIAGVPAGEGERTLIVNNPGPRRATVSVVALTAQGAFAPAGAESVDVNAESTTSVRIDSALRGDVSGLKLTSSQPVRAAVRATSTDGDVAFSPARPAFAGRSVVPLVPNSALVLTNPGESEASVTIAVDEGTATPTLVAPHTTIQVPVTTGRSAELATSSSDLRIAMIVTQVDQVKGIGVVALGPGGIAESTVSPTLDPRLAPA